MHSCRWWMIYSAITTISSYHTYINGMLQLVIDPLQNYCPLQGELLMKTSTPTCSCECVVMCSQTHCFFSNELTFFSPHFESKCSDEEISAKEKWVVGGGGRSVPTLFCLSPHVNCAESLCKAFSKLAFLALESKSCHHAGLGTPLQKGSNTPCKHERNMRDMREHVPNPTFFHYFPLNGNLPGI